MNYIKFLLVALCCSFGLSVHAMEEANSPEGTLLHAASMNSRRYEELRTLLEHNATTKEIDINARDQYGLTPLMCAARAGEERAAFLLLLYGADATLTALDNSNALMIGLQHGHAEVARKMLVHLRSKQDPHPLEQVLEQRNDANQRAYTIARKSLQDMDPDFRNPLIELLYPASYKQLIRPQHHPALHRRPVQHTQQPNGHPQLTAKQKKAEKKKQKKAEKKQKKVNDN